MGKGRDKLLLKEQNVLYYANLKSIVQRLSMVDIIDITSYLIPVERMND